MNQSQMTATPRSATFSGSHTTVTPTADTKMAQSGRILPNVGKLFSGRHETVRSRRSTWRHAPTSAMGESVANQTVFRKPADWPHWLPQVIHFPAARWHWTQHRYAVRLGCAATRGYYARRVRVPRGRMPGGTLAGTLTHVMRGN